jgi:ABC-type nitrate/sulfonate/bicarbonate transport system substrate-binding protein
LAAEWHGVCKISGEVEADLVIRANGGPVLRTTAFELHKTCAVERYFFGNDDMSRAEELTLGVMPLTDAAPLIVAAEKGFFAAENLDVSLVREAS